MTFSPYNVREEGLKLTSTRVFVMSGSLLKANLSWRMEVQKPSQTNKLEWGG